MLDSVISRSGRTKKSNQRQFDGRTRYVTWDVLRTPYGIICCVFRKQAG